MQDLIEWLKQIEEYASKLYTDAATLFPENPGLCRMLGDLARDEEWHYHLMGSAADYLNTQRLEPEPAVVLDDRIVGRVEGPFHENIRKLSTGTLTAESVVECIAASEFSEWNDIFLYVVNTMKEHSRAFQFGAAMMQDHIHKVENFLGVVPDERGMLQKLRKLPPVWKQHVLVVDDDLPVRELLRAFFERQAVVDTAENGALALDKIHRKFYDAIVTDIDMPIMNGMDFFRHATAHDPDLRNRFVFTSGGDSPEIHGFLKNQKQPFMPKPFSLSELGETVQGIMRIAARESVLFNVNDNP